MRYLNYQFLVRYRAALAGLHDFIVTCLAWVLAYMLRFNFSIPDTFHQSLKLMLLIAVPVQMVFFVRQGLYKGIWRFASIPDLKRILYAVAISSAIVSLSVFMSSLVVVPRSVLILDPLLLIIFLGGSRFFYRAWQEHRLYGILSEQGKPVFIIGAGDAGVALVKDLSRSKDWRVIGFLDDDQVIQGRQLADVKVLGGIDELAELAASYAVNHVIIAMPAAAHQARRRAVDLANAQSISVLTVPAFDDLMSGRLSVSQIRKVEVEDLLGRDAVSLDITGLTHAIEYQIVLVSGAGGSIGSELCKQILKFNPKLLVCLDISEYALYQLEQSISGSVIASQALFLVRDVKNTESIAEILTKYRPSTVFHAAAYKHVPMMEKYNVYSALENNVVGTYALAHASKEAGVRQFVLISTDKAVNPTNVMGASKRMAEMVCQGLQDSVGTKFVIVRFGNVLGSSGSVIPKFREQIAKGGPVTVTHPEITRYFMSIPEAAQLVMQAGLMGQGGEIFVLDMGEPVKIADLAANMIRLSGFDTDQMKIVFTGLRPGEKLYEELLADDEHTLPTAHPKLRIAQARKADIIWVRDLISWIRAVRNEDEMTIKTQMMQWISEYQAQLESADKNMQAPIVDVKNIIIH